MDTTNHETLNQTEASLERLRTDLATVMGPAQAGSLDQQQLTDIIQQLGLPPAKQASNAAKQEYSSKLAAAIQKQTQEQALNEYQAVKDKFNQAINDNVLKVKNAVRSTVEQCEQALAQQGASNSTQGLPNRQATAEQTFKASIDTITSMLSQITNHQTCLKGYNAKLNCAYNTVSDDVNADNTEVSERINQIHTMRRNIQEQINTLQNDIIRYFDNTINAGKSKTNLIPLTIPKDVHTGKGQQVIDNMKAYLRGRAAEYYAIIPYLMRISDDYNAEEGTYWEPPARRQGGYNMVNNAMRQAYADQSYALYYVIKEQLSAETYSRISSTYKYGIHEQKENRCEAWDGPAAYFALISLYKPIKASHRDTLTEEFNTAWTHFTKGDPKKKIKHLRPKLVEAIQLGLQLNWSTTGKKIVQVLSRSDHVMAQELKQFEKGPTKPEDTNLYLQNLFAAIEAEADKATLTFQGEKKEWHASSVSAADRRMCRYGADCTDNLCTRSHPPGYKRPRSEHYDYKTKGKGGKGSKGKGGNGKGGKGKSGKGGKGRPACEAQGCSHPTPHPSKTLCTTCFKKVIETGSITKKDGTVFVIKPKAVLDNSKQMSTSTYGFSAEQLEGLRVLQQTTAYRAEGLSAEEEEQPAPASIKRARMAERLGRADAAQLSQDERTIRFLSAINRQ